MDQIYYTQCPIGYGLGASNGFQIKRRTAEYPVSGDFRHLGLRAFISGTRTQAPPALRYRRDGEIAEIAWLTPRPREYETERGQWGRPGGHFAHGIRLTPEEMIAVAHWPAGLYDRPFWRRSDPEPTRGKEPDALALGPEDLLGPANFETAARLAAGFEFDADRLARLLFAAAVAAREGRILFLIDAPERLGNLIALLTLAFPEASRRVLTFSTYHDRPEELPGYRLQGTIAATKPNRALLASLGYVADLASGAIEPKIEPSRWAKTLASWLVRRDPEDAQAWTDACLKFANQAGPQSIEAALDESWIAHLIEFHTHARVLISPPTEPAGWEILSEFASWSGQTGLGAEWSSARGPDWWRSALKTAGISREGRKALLAQLSLPETWRAGEPTDWAKTVAPWLERADSRERLSAIDVIGNSAPSSALPSILFALIGSFSIEVAESTIKSLNSSHKKYEHILPVLEVRGAIARFVKDRSIDPLSDLWSRALRSRALIPAVLDALAEERSRLSSSMKPLLNEPIARFYQEADRLNRPEPIAWAVRRDDAIVWLEPWLRKLFALSDNQDAWRKTRDGLNEELRPAFARAFLATVQTWRSDDPFLWGVEELLLTIPENIRPEHPSWPDEYLRRIASGLDLIRKVFNKKTRDPRVVKWLAEARSRHLLSEEQEKRLVRAKDYWRMLQENDPRGLLQVRLPDVPEAERGALLGQLLDHFGDAEIRRVDLCLESCRREWPGAFEAGAPGLDRLAEPLAKLLKPFRESPEAWMERLEQLLQELRLPRGGSDSTAKPSGGFEPDGLAAAILASTTRMDVSRGDAWPWRLRAAFLRSDLAWKALRLDASRALSPPESVDPVDSFSLWDEKLSEGDKKIIARLYELLLNSADGPALTAIVKARARDFKSIAVRLAWWNSSREPGATDDIRDAFARLAPIAPLETNSRESIADWMRSFREVESGHQDLKPLEWEKKVQADWSHLSELGLARWRAIEALDRFEKDEQNDDDRWRHYLAEWKMPLLNGLDIDDRYRFVAWLINLTSNYHKIPIERFASWLIGQGVTDGSRLTDWSRGLPETSLRVSVANSVLMEFINKIKRELIKTLDDKGLKPSGPDFSP